MLNSSRRHLQISNVSDVCECCLLIDKDLCEVCTFLYVPIIIFLEISLLFNSKGYHLFIPFFMFSVLSLSLWFIYRRIFFF